MQLPMVILGNFEKFMKKKTHLVILVIYKDNYDTTTTTANKSMGFDLSAIQSCLLLVFLDFLYTEIKLIPRCLMPKHKTVMDSLS